MNTEPSPIQSIEMWLSGSSAFCRKHKRPLISLCYAQSLDGSVTYRRGRPLALSGLPAMEMTHKLRSLHDGILLGIGTVLADDPRLTVRLTEGENPQPVILDSRLRTPLQAKLIREHPCHPWIITSPDSDPSRRAALEAAGALLIDVPYEPDDCIQLPYMLQHLAEIGIHSLMVEGGAQVITNFLSQGLVDFVVITICPVFVGGLRAIEHLIYPGRNEATGNFPRLSEVGYQRLGDDLVTWGRFVN